MIIHHIRSILIGVAVVVLGSLPAAAQATLPPDFSVAKPTFGPAKLKITDFGAVGDGKTVNTEAFHKAVAACQKAGGGTLVVPKGTFLTGPFSLASNLNLRLDDGATIMFTGNPADFPVSGGHYENEISAKDCHDLAITGSGTIDGNGKKFWDSFLKVKNAPPGMYPRRPRLVELEDCTRVLVQGVTLTQSPMFHLVPARCHDVTIDGIRIFSPSPSPNTDGIDPSGDDFLITHCKIDTGDDCIAIKGGGSHFDPQHYSVDDFLITDCTFLHGHGMSIGSETNGGVRNVVVRNCTFDSTDAGIRLKSPPGRGGPCEYLTYEDLKMKNVKVPILITSWYPKIPKDLPQYPARPVTPLTPIWRHILIKNVTAVDSDIAGQIVGLAEMPIEDVTLQNVHVSADKPIEIMHAKGIRFIDSRISSKSGKPILFDATVEGLN